MTQPPDSSSQSNLSKPDSGSDSGTGGKLLKGCGLFVVLGIMMLGILVIGGFDSTSWASAIIGALVGVLVFKFSGINGSWED